jgi:hypothetical protein
MPKAKKITQPGWIHPDHRDRNASKKIGFDIHGVIDANGEVTRVFRLIMRALIRDGWEVHIITGAPWKMEEPVLKKMRIPFTHFFSIVDHHQRIGTKIEWDPEGNAHLDVALWDRTKAIYCEEHGVDMHFDDSDIYRFYFKTPYVRFFSNDSDRVKKIHNSK